MTENKKTAFVPVVIKRVTMPTLKLVANEPVYVRILEAIFTGRDIKAPEGETATEKKERESRKPPKIMNVANLETGEVMQLVCGAVVLSEITETYPGEDYVGLCFMIVKGKKKEKSGGRGYFTYEIAQIEDPEKTAKKK